MELIIQYFLEKVISLKEESFKNLNDINFLSDFTDELNANLMELGREIVKNYIKELEEIIYESKERKKEYISYQKESLANSRKLITIFGEIEFSRRYYSNKETKEKSYLLDKMIGLKEDERILKNVEENMLDIATVKSYEYASKKAAYNVDLSKETVKNKIKKIKFPKVKLEEKEKNKKRKVSRIYIQADEDHVSLQEGGIAMPRLITVYEDNIKGKLVGKRKFGGMYEGNIDELWEEVYSYIENEYDYEYIKEIFIIGDGAQWIKTGLEWLPKSIYVADRFHINNTITQIFGKNDDKNKEELREAMFNFDFKRVKEVGEKYLKKERNEKIKYRKTERLKYILNNEEGFKNSIKYDVPGCAAEGDISHTYSDRLSSRPLGWSKENVDKMARLRILKANGENIKIITRNEVNEDENVIEEQKKVSKYIKKQKYKRADEIIYSIPELKYGDYEIREKLKELIKCEAV